MLMKSSAVNAISNSIKLICFDDTRGEFPDPRLFYVNGPQSNPTALRIKPDHHLCSACQRVFGYFAYYYSQFARLSRSRDNKVPLRPDLIPCVAHHPNLISLRESYVEHCYCCTTLHQKICLVVPSFDLITAASPVSGARWATEAQWLDNTTGKSLDPYGNYLQFSLVDLKSERSSDSVAGLMRFNLWHACGTETSPFFDIHLHSNTSLSQNLGVDTRLSRGNTACETSKKFAIGWLQKCRENLDGMHNECNRTTTSWMPRRLLDVTSALMTNFLKLVTFQSLDRSSKEQVPYVTLSHCWGIWGQVKNGKSTIPILTAGNLKKRHTEGISLDNLPKTFREALKVAGWYNVKWLWIDSLCVIQDRLDDWRKTAAEMSKIYSHALLNISADAASDARDGLFRERSIVSITPLTLDVPSLSWTLLLMPSERYLFDFVYHAPLASRAWALQERQLARRVLHFCSSQLFWECCARNPSFACEMYPDGAKLPPPHKRNEKYRKSKPSDICKAWSDICQIYSRLNLSQQSDKLAAIAGMAEDFGQYLSIPGPYLAGMWRCDMPEALLWKVDKDENPSLKAKPRLDTAPSWSWASVDGLVVMQHMEFNPLPRWHGENMAIADIVDTLIDGQPCEINNKDIWTSSNITLIVRGIVRQFTWYRDFADEAPPIFPYKANPEPQSFVEFADDWTRVRPRPHFNDWADGFRIELDIPDPCQTIEAFLLLIQISETDSCGGQFKLSIRCLVLQEDANSLGSFRRIGVARFSGWPVNSLRYLMNDEWHGCESDEFWASHIELLPFDTPQQQAIAQSMTEHGTVQTSWPATNENWERIYTTSLAIEDEQYFTRLTPRVIKLI